MSNIGLVAEVIFVDVGFLRRDILPVVHCRVSVRQTLLERVQNFLQVQDVDLELYIDRLPFTPLLAWELQSRCRERAGNLGSVGLQNILEEIHRSPESFLQEYVIFRELVTLQHSPELVNHDYWVRYVVELRVFRIADLAVQLLSRPPRPDRLDAQKLQKYHHETDQNRQHRLVVVRLEQKYEGEQHE